ncbi:hypothetical protein [Bradyrhizobium sp. BR 10289]|uniref:hypothetical protein n=1 Tax=Bradyrhizobium sp. BR 10289 TaxID=2749993 RepID=UPI001C646571|nr:hypothetical protein [Bradyrhizobium sp. BR 10289]MBW7970027.1 hypothetical protein [Bradyrhizobium sp. BR 10289]
MAGDNAHIRRVHDEASMIAEQTARMREMTVKAFEILKMATPDTFLGRKTQEPFPVEPSRDRNP